MGEIDIRLLLRQLRLKPEDTEDMERELMEMYRERHRAGRPHETRAGKVGKLRIVGRDREGS